MKIDHPRIRNVPDPAMEQLQETGNGIIIAETEVQDATQTQATQNIPDTFTVDLENKRVFLLDKGWIEASEFWDIYYNHAEELPADIDHAALEKLRMNGTVDSHTIQ